MNKLLSREVFAYMRHENLLKTTYPTEHAGDDITLFLDIEFLIRGPQTTRLHLPRKRLPETFIKNCHIKSSEGLISAVPHQDMLLEIESYYSHEQLRQRVQGPLALP